MEKKTPTQGNKTTRTKASQPTQNESYFLNELQEFLSEELVEQGTIYRRSFIPITEGLGLESPLKLTPKIKVDEEINKPDVDLDQKSRTSDVIFTETTEVKQSNYKWDDTNQDTAPPPGIPEKQTENRLAEVMEPPPLAEQTHTRENQIGVPKLEVLSASDRKHHSQPPPLPRPSIFKRLLAGIIDHVFVLLIWTALIVFTSNWMNEFTTGFSIQILTDFGQPKFQRIAILEFAAAWFGYLGFSLLIARRTFGMWVWSIGVSYGDKIEENYTMRKAMRIFWTFLFSAPIVPSILLMINRNGRNILDVLSGTNVYDSN